MNIETLQALGVRILAPETNYFENIDHESVGAGTVIYPGASLIGPDISIGENCEIRRAGGAYIKNCAIENNVKIYGGSFEDSVIRSGCVIRSGAELRDACIIEEECELAHCVGLKQSILFPQVIVGSLVNFCDVTMCGGFDRKNHSEVGSCMALYNFTPWGDKFASIFGDVDRGLFLKQKPIFIGGQTQIVSPVKVGFGSVIAAGSFLDRSVEDNRLVCFAGRNFDMPMPETGKGRVDQKIALTLEYMRNLRMLELWYVKVRAASDALHPASLRVHVKALENIRKASEERKKRLLRFVSHNAPEKADTVSKAVNIAVDVHAPDEALRTISELLINTPYISTVRSLDDALVSKAIKELHKHLPNQ